MCLLCQSSVTVQLSVGFIFVQRCCFGMGVLYIMISNPFFRDNEEKLTYLDVLRCVCIDSEVVGNGCVCV